MLDDNDRDNNFIILFSGNENDIVDMYEHVIGNDKKYRAFVLFFMRYVVGTTRWKFGVVRAIKYECFETNIKTKDDETFVMLLIENSWSKWRQEAMFRRENGMQLDDRMPRMLNNSDILKTKYTEHMLEETDGTQGPLSFRDWSVAGLKRYQEIRGLLDEHDTMYALRQQKLITSLRESNQRNRNLDDMFSEYKKQSRRERNESHEYLNTSFNFSQLTSL